MMGNEDEDDATICFMRFRSANCLDVFVVCVLHNSPNISVIALLHTSYKSYLVNMLLCDS